jgi:general secretion pathway protein K
MNRRGTDGGYISIAVLTVGTLIAALAVALLQVARPSLERSRLGADEVRATALIDGGIASAGYLLFIAGKDARTVSGRRLAFDEGSVQLTVSDEGGRIDLNAGDRSLLSGLFAAVGGESMTAAAFAARVSDWRDADSDRSEDGGEADDYHGAGLGYGPRDGPFQSVAELKLLLGLSVTDYDRLAPYVTVFNPHAGIDPLSAPLPVLRAVPGLTRAEAETLIGRQKDGSRDEDWYKTLVQAHSAVLSADPAGVYRVTALAQLDDGYAAMGETVMTAASEGGTAYRIAFWQTGPAPPAKRGATLR